jgi:glycerol kinase
VNEIWSSQISCAAEAIAKIGISGREIAAIGITNQRETTIVWDRETSKPLYNAIVWQDRRTAKYCDKLKAEGCRNDSKKDRASFRRLFFWN